MGALRHFIGNRNDLAFQRGRNLPLESQTVGVKIRVSILAALQPRVFENALAHRGGEIKPGEIILLFEEIDNAERLIIVFEAAIRTARQRIVQRVAALQEVVQNFFAEMAKRRVAKIMAQSDGLDQVFIQGQRARNRARDLRDLERVRHTRAEMIAFGNEKHLAFVFQAAECARMHQAVAITLKGDAILVLRLGVQAGGVRLAIAARIRREPLFFQPEPVSGCANAVGHFDLKSNGGVQSARARALLQVI